MITTFLSLFLVIIFAYEARRRYYALPLDRDYGAYTYVINQWQRGRFPGREVPHSKPLLFLLIYQFILASNKGSMSRIAFRFYGNIVLTIITCAIYIISAVSFGERAGLIAATAFAVVSCLPSLWWHMANAEMYYLIPSVLCYIVTSLTSHVGQIPALFLLFLAGALASSAFHIKQPAVLSISVPISVWIIAAQWHDPIMAAAAWMLFFAGHIPSMLIYEIWCNRNKIPPEGRMFPFCSNVRGIGRYFNNSLHLRNPTAFHHHRAWMRRLAYDLLLVSVFALAAIWKMPGDPAITLFALWMLSGFLSGIMGRTYLPYHFIPMVPGACILSGVYLSHGLDPTALILVAIGFPLLIYHLSHDLSQDPRALDQQYSGENQLFEASEVVGKWIKENSQPDSLIYVWGAEQGIYGWAERGAAVSNIYCPVSNPPVFTEEAKQKEWDELLVSLPRFVVQTMETTGFPWFESFLRSLYTARGVVKGMIIHERKKGA